MCREVIVAGVDPDEERVGVRDIVGAEDVIQVWHAVRLQLREVAIG